MKSCSTIIPKNLPKYRIWDQTLLIWQLTSDHVWARITMEVRSSVENQIWSLVAEHLKASIDNQKRERN